MKMRSRGFTLVEVLIAMVVLAGASIVLYQSWSGSLSAVRKGRNFSTITFLLQKKLVEFEVQNKGKKIEELEGVGKGNFGNDFPDYTWQIEVKPFSLPPITPPKAEGGNDNGLAEIIIKTMTEYFEKAVREVRVTVYYKRGDRTQEYPASMIFVDFSQEIPSGF
ncbi:MAG: prepilin-type N-terminal cleavage/methylation domain-containing protein [Oligoflexia bacterium]|nr:prepilin-type N-terminal cleavage/methylation domain-containing protein [Oligoflexia bacterium]